ncbi:camphor resistance protein CrcB [Aedoeadaptatus ivorii]|uniref:Fluoride-specific ion channel FluC n=1 Tax=Aedoeadaptatus ivorii TaxID=54006 RepID=A0A3S5F7Y1_9FIRM|nr:fluoride efflux transporter CrcB [Peptoniphilus ivorii]MDQ0508796.1 CrcB protein [Peptoniphilus ivorii]VEJ36084.1 camphor resistance protein CrcB [Peptoniphilus ivorii]
MQLLYAAAGGALGAACRFALSYLPVSNRNLPPATLLANLIGCFLMGVLSAKAEARGWHPNLEIFLQAGFCGGLTTFSAFSKETVSMAQKGQLPAATLYIVSTVALGFLAFYLGQQAAK